MESIILKFKRVDPRATIPTPKHVGDVGMDVKVISVEYNVELDEYIYDTGLACETEMYHSMFAFCRSSVHKFEYYLTNHVGIIDPANYRGTIKAIFRHRDSLETRLTNRAMKIWDSLSWYQKLKRGSFKHIKETLRKDFLKDPIRYAPYKPGDAAFQIWMERICPVEVIEVDELSENTDRGTDGGVNRK